MGTQAVRETILIAALAIASALIVASFFKTLIESAPKTGAGSPHVRAPIAIAVNLVMAMSAYFILSP